MIILFTLVTYASFGGEGVTYVDVCSVCSVGIVCKIKVYVTRFGKMSRKRNVPRKLE